MTGRSLNLEVQLNWPWGRQRSLLCRVFTTTGGDRQDWLGNAAEAIPTMLIDDILELDFARG
jgi:hypothetical protein